ncbi:hemin uptake protein HemP [Terrarubrum flagellatum]|uniref:hemin uptake protein HemP n=1 Tax=Terrirubrum flagellatum TaxID=2895980 RepID=UPI003144DED4
MIANSKSGSDGARHDEKTRAFDHPSPEDGQSPPAIDVKTLVGEGREAIILHKGDRYRLRITANDKLILTK